MSFFIKLIIVALLLTIIFNLFRAMIVMLKPQSQQQSMSHFIGKRLVFSVALIVMLLILLALGIIQPNANPY